MMVSYQRYLEAKKTIDDRSLNKTVFNQLLRSLPAAGDLRVLECGAGIGTMIMRGIEWGLLRRAGYVAVDKDPQNITYSRQCLNRWASSSGFEVESHVRYPILLTKEDRVISVDFRVNDILDYIESEKPGMYDLIMAHSFLDLLDLSQYFPFFMRMLKKNGLFYFSLLFDGLTVLRPEVDPQLDERIISIYHDTMNTKKTEMGYKRSETGRYILEQLGSSNQVMLLEAGSSDWVLCCRHRGYSKDELDFLHFIIDTVFQAVEPLEVIEGERLREWIKLRHHQIDCNELILIAHQMDVVGRLIDPLTSK